MDLLPMLVTLFAGLGIGTFGGTIVTSKAGGRKQMWDNLNRLDDQVRSSDDDEARLAFNHLSDFVDHKALDKQQRIFARTAIREYLRRTS